MDEQQEREKLEEECLQLARLMACARAEALSPINKQTGVTDEQFAYFCRRVYQAGQSLALSGFLTNLLENSFKLVRDPEKAEAIGSENVELIHDFLSRYTCLLEQEIHWNKKDEKHHSPPGT